MRCHRWRISAASPREGGPYCHDLNTRLNTMISFSVFGGYFQYQRNHGGAPARIDRSEPGRCAPAPSRTPLGLRDVGQAAPKPHEATQQVQVLPGKGDLPSRKRVLRGCRKERVTVAAKRRQRACGPCDRAPKANTSVGADGVGSPEGNTVAIESRAASPKKVDAPRAPRGLRTGHVREGCPGTWETPTPPPHEAVQRIEGNEETPRASGSQSIRVGARTWGNPELTNHLTETRVASEAGEGKAGRGAHDAGPRYRPGVAARGVSAHAQGRSARRRRTKRGAVRGAPGGQPPVAPRPREVRGVPRAARAAGPHPEGGGGGNAPPRHSDLRR